MRTVNSLPGCDGAGSVKEAIPFYSEAVAWKTQYLTSWINLSGNPVWGGGTGYRCQTPKDIDSAFQVCRDFNCHWKVPVVFNVTIEGLNGSHRVAGADRPHDVSTNVLRFASFSGPAYQEIKRQIHSKMFLSCKRTIQRWSKWDWLEYHPKSIPGPWGSEAYQWQYKSLSNFKIHSKEIFLTHSYCDICKGL